MGLEDRDWYREEPSKAWNRMFRSSTPSYGTSTQDVGGQPGPSPSRLTARRRRRLRAWVAPLAIGAAIPVLAFIGWQERDPLSAAADDLMSRLSTDDGQTPMLGSPLSGVGADAKVVHLRPRPELDVPVTRVTRWSLSDPRFGRVSVYVPIGQTPREALTIAIAERGYQVVR